jgi:hypothetical protein
VSRRWLIANKGFNSEYVGWGGEDDDLILRMELSGLKQEQLHNNPIHLWHPSYAKLCHGAGRGPEYAKAVLANQERYWSFRRKVRPE